ncbi:MAG: TRAP transporter large permease [Betaproteobacteria bacterium]
MSWELAGAVYLVLMLVLLLGGVWIAVALGMVGIVGIALLQPALLAGVASVVWGQLDSFVLTAVPLFLFMGSVLMISGVSGRFYRGLAPWLVRVPGGLAQSNIVACAIFAALCGSSVATAGAIGSVAIPEMRSRGYDPRVTAGTLAAGGTLGILIPPSIPFIIYGSSVGESVGRLFAAGMMPGLLLTLLFMLFLGIQATIRPGLVPPHEKVPAAGKLKTFPDMLPILALIVIVLGGIYAGVMTPTEAAGVGASGALAIAALYRKLTWAVLRQSLMETVRANAMILLIVVSAQVMSFALVSVGVPRGIVGWIAALEASRWVVFGVIVVAYLVLGCLMDALSLMLLTLPVVFPVIQALGFDPIWFGVVLVLLLEIGLITPPVGMNLFVIQGISGRPLGEVSWGAFPYVIIMLVEILLLVLFPSIALWLPAKVF